LAKYKYDSFYSPRRVGGGQLVLGKNNVFLG
jgi:hypothetical protein